MQRFIDQRHLTTPDTLLALRQWLLVRFWQVVGAGAYAAYCYQSKVRPMLIGMALYVLSAIMAFLASTLLSLN